MQIEEALAMFTLQLEADGRSPHTIGQFQRHVRALARWHAGPIESVTHEVLARFLVSPEARLRHDGKPKKATAMNALRSSIRGFFGYLSASGALPRDPARLVRRARCGPPLPRTLSPVDQHRLLTVLRLDDGGRDYALIHFLSATGARIGSALGLRIEDLDLARGEAHVRKGKGDRPLTIVLGREIREHLVQFVGDRTSGPLFTSRHGSAVTGRHAGRRLRYWAERAGLTTVPSPHVLRHSFATALLAKTGDLALVQVALHHASIASTVTYARVAPERLRAVLGA